MRNYSSSIYKRLFGYKRQLGLDKRRSVLDTIGYWINLNILEYSIQVPSLQKYSANVFGCNLFRLFAHFNQAFTCFSGLLHFVSITLPLASVNSFTCYIHSGVKSNQIKSIGHCLISFTFIHVHTHSLIQRWSISLSSLVCNLCNGFS